MKTIKVLVLLTLATGTVSDSFGGLQRTVKLDGGTVELSKPKVLTALDSGTVFAAKPGTRPIWSAGRRIRNWSVDEKGWWHAKLPSGVRCSQLYVNGQRRERPSVPRGGYFYLDGEEPKVGNTQCFRVGTNQVDASWQNLGEIEVCVMHHWNMSRLRPAAYDAVSRIVTCTRPRIGLSYCPFGPYTWYRLENVRAALGEPGDWYLAKDGDLVYVPRPGEHPEASEVVAATGEHVLKIDGARDITFRGITFAYAGWNLPETGNNFPQAAANLPAAVEVWRSRDIRFEDCAFVHTGGYGLAFEPGTCDSQAVGCEFSDLGAGGIKIGCACFTGHCDCSNGKDNSEIHPETPVSNCLVENCLIEHGGRVDPAGIGVWIGNAGSNRVVRNTIRDFHYTGISVGWVWDRKASAAHDNLIEANDIRDIGQGVLTDLGGIYLLGLQPRTTVRGNEIRNVRPSRWCGHGIYLDQGSSFITVEDNFVDGYFDAGCFVQFNTASNVVRNNVFANGRAKMQKHSGDTKHRTFPTLFEGNVFRWSDPDVVLTSEPISTNYMVCVSNVVWCEGLDASLSAQGIEQRLPPKTCPRKPVGRRRPAVLTADLPSVPSVFPPAPERPRVGAFRQEPVDGKPVPQMEALLTDGSRLSPVYVVLEAGVLNYDFGARGYFYVTMKQADGRWEFCTIENTLKGVERIVFRAGRGDSRRPVVVLPRNRGFIGKRFAVSTEKSAFSPRMVHSAFGIDSYPDDYLESVTKTGVDSILVYISNPPDVTRTGRHENIGDIVERAAKFGIGVYAYADFPVKAAKMHPEEPGAEAWYDEIYGSIVRRAPGLKGLVCVGESVAFPYRDHRPTDYWWRPCPGGAPSTGFRPDLDWAAWLRLVKKVTRRYNPDFDLVFWTYNWYRQPEADRVALLERIPTDVSLLVTFEMGDVPVKKCGLDTIVMDYSITRPGPGMTFRSEAEVAKRRGIRLYSMTNTGGRTWDFGLLPYEPVPWCWKERFEALRTAREKWGLAGLMESHHYGFRPNFIAELATKVFADDYRSERFEKILRDFAVRDYGEENADAVMGAWKDFSEAFQWHSAMANDLATVLRNGPVYPLCRPDTEIPDPLHPVYEFHDGVKHGCGWKFTATTFSFDLERIPGELEMAVKEIALLETGCRKLQGREKARTLWAMGRFMLATIRTMSHAKRYYRAGKANDRAEMEVVLRAEEENVRSCFEWVDVSPAIGWEPMMGRVVARDTLEWKLAQLKQELRHCRLTAELPTR